MLNNSSVSMYSDVHTSILYCMHARSHDKCAMRRCADARSCQLANRCQANCSLQNDRASSAQYAIPAFATSLVLTAGMCKPSVALGGHRCAAKQPLPALSGSMPSEARPATTLRGALPPWPGAGAAAAAAAAACSQHGRTSLLLRCHAASAAPLGAGCCRIRR